MGAGDLTCTAANVRPVGHCIVRRFTAAATLTPGMPVYVSTNDTVNKANGGALATAQCIGIVLSDGSGSTSFASTTVVDVLLRGTVEGFTANVTAGSHAWMSDVAGVMNTTAGTKKCLVGIGVNTTMLYVNPICISNS